VRLSFLPALAGIIALTAPLAGCGDVAPSPASPTSGPIKPLFGGVKIVALGQEQVTGLYQVTLTNTPTQTAGLFNFTAHVSEKGKPQDKGKPLDKGFVSLALVPPGATHEDDAKRMDKVEAGTFRTTLRADKAGEWMAKVTVVGVSSTDPAYYSFKIN
jgi:hypothetical protein